MATIEQIRNKLIQYIKDNITDIKSTDHPLSAAVFPSLWIDEGNFNVIYDGINIKSRRFEFNAYLVDQPGILGVQEMVEELGVVAEQITELLLNNPTLDGYVSDITSVSVKNAITPYVTEGMDLVILPIQIIIIDYN